MLMLVAERRMNGSALERMLQEIERDVRYTQHHLGFASLSSPVARALREVPRHTFVPGSLQHRAYDNTPLPIGDNQTISQPYIVAIMTELLALAAEHRVLEIGTGSGYQTAILAQLVNRVYSIEIISTLALRTAALLERLGYSNIETRCADGYYGWPEAAPFDAVMITAATDAVPAPLLEQLKPDGRLLAPLNRGCHQELLLMSKGDHGTLHQRTILPVAFVPMTGVSRDRALRASP